jgi:hypothetical protein
MATLPTPVQYLAERLSLTFDLRMILLLSGVSGRSSRSVLVRTPKLSASCSAQQRSPLAEKHGLMRFQELGMPHLIAPQKGLLFAASCTEMCGLGAFILTLKSRSEPLRRQKLPTTE